MRLALLLLFVVAAATVWITNSLLTERFTEGTRLAAENQITSLAKNIQTELESAENIPFFLSRDLKLIAALNTGDYSLSTQHLMSYVEEGKEASSLMLLDLEGRTVAATDRNRIGTQFRQEGIFVDALRSEKVVFDIVPRDPVGYDFYYARRLESQGQPVGVLMAEVDLRQYVEIWAGMTQNGRSQAITINQGSGGPILLSTERRWLGLTEAEALARETPQNAIRRAVQMTTGADSLPVDTYIEGNAVLRAEQDLNHRGWRMTTYTNYNSVREKVNTVLALEIMVFAILLALAFYALNRKTTVRMAGFQRESAELRTLNRRLQREIAERERVQENLAVAEQSLAQSSKLAALGEMSAAVSHELNQPLAAMKTYLAGARLLLRRERPDEALASFGRIDDLIERMGAITRQLKSYARKGGDELSPVNMGDALASALSMMEPQLRQRHVRISQALPTEPVFVMGDRMRIEQVMVNLLRNGLDATKSVATPEIEIILAAGETATLTVRDNGIGIRDLDSLFEPFYTTKEPGDGVGLGLAISSGIVSDLGGRLTARNSQRGGAVFEMQLPIHDEKIAAE